VKEFFNNNSIFKESSRSGVQTTLEMISANKKFLKNVVTELEKWLQEEFLL